jgi:hypothetical protein
MLAVLPITGLAILSIGAGWHKLETLWPGLFVIWILAGLCLGVFVVAVHSRPIEYRVSSSVWTTLLIMTTLNALAGVVSLVVMSLPPRLGVDSVISPGALLFSVVTIGLILFGIEAAISDRILEGSQERMAYKIMTAIGLLMMPAALLLAIVMVIFLPAFQ